MAGCGFAHASTKPKSPQDIWYSIYILGKHAGYSHIVTAPSNYDGRPANLSVSTTVTKITMLGSEVDQNVDSKSWSDENTGQPIFQSFDIESGGTSTDVDATFSPTSISARLKTGEDITTSVIRMV
jgi:hypothetical protein